MAAIDDLIKQIDEKALRDRLRTEVDRLTKEKSFGLVFENHLPELTPIYNAEVQTGSRVARRDNDLSSTWRVLRIIGKKALCLEPTSGNHKEIPVSELVVVRRFGESIFPTLTPIDKVQNNSDDAPWHVLIEADNYHALQLLEYLYAGQVDCIYIDPPYNTGASDWKYNNDFVDENDNWRHSKWLAFMQRRLLLAKRLLKPNSGVLVVTIDEHEVHHLGSLLLKLFPEARRQMVTIVNNAAGVSQGGFYRVEEYAFFCFLGDAKPVPISDDFLSKEEKKITTPIWFSLIRYGGINALPSKRAGLVYPIAIDPDKGKIVATGRTLAQRVKEGDVSGNLDKWAPDKEERIAGLPVVWPFRGSGLLSTWQLMPETLLDLSQEGFVRVREQPNGPGGNQWSISYIKSGNREKIHAGEIPILDREPSNGSVIVGNVSRQVVPKTVWKRAKHDAGKWGSRTIREILGSVSFDYAKSPYVVRDTLDTVVGDRPDALILDFFAGSGTTLHAVEMLNAIDNGNRRCILVTNNEVSEDKGKTLAEQGHQPGSSEWEENGICQSITYPRLKYTILGRRDNGTELEGEYITGITVAKEKKRTFRRLGFVDPDTLSTAARKKEIAGLIEGLSTSHIKTETTFYVPEDENKTVAILFDDTQTDAFLDALEDAHYVTHFYIITRSNKTFQHLKIQINEMLGAIELQEEEKRPMREGFSANLEYFKLNFLEKDRVALGQGLYEILPVLWMRAGAIGPRPELPEDEPVPAILLPEQNPFAVLVNENRFADFQAEVEKRKDLTHIFLVTDSEEAFQEMAAQLTSPNIIQLYRDYLENFAINRGESA